jgi:hypothetical protein
MCVLMATAGKDRELQGMWPRFLARPGTQVLAGVQQHGVAPGARLMMDMEEEAAQTSLESGLYVTWRSRSGTDCTRVGPRSKCFCGHTYSDHHFVTRKAAHPNCKACACRSFEFIPQRCAGGGRAGQCIRGT